MQNETNIAPLRRITRRPHLARVRRRPTCDSEHAEQAALFRWAEFARSRLPELALLHAIPNGGHRHKATAARLKAEGVKRGVPDVCLPVPRGGAHGLYIELKTERGKPTPEQLGWIRALRGRGLPRLGERAQHDRALPDGGTAPRPGARHSNPISERSKP
jgi:hypothetical protein